jgi:hypothetical protein
MPLTFLAHQGPFLPIARRYQRHLDPVTFLIGTMAPDFAYVGEGTRFGVWAHALPWIVTFNVPVTLFVSWVLVRVIAPVVPDHLPNAGGFGLKSYRRLTQHRFRLLVSPLSALLGALTHVVLDQFTHAWGWAARHVDWYRRPLVDQRWLGKRWTPFEFAQFGGHVGLSILCLVLLWIYGRQRQRTLTELPAPQRTSGRSHLTLWVVAASWSAAGVAWVATHRISEGADVLRVAAGVGFGLALGSVCVLTARGEPIRFASSPGTPSLRRPG